LPNIGHEIWQGEVAFRIRKDGKAVKVLSPIDSRLSVQKASCGRRAQEAFE
jgi:hypothetical protein